MASSGAWITTFSGRRFYVLDPRAEDVAIEDIAHALSLQCRFTGHLKNFYSVAQHSVLVSRLCTRDALWGLLHDASEAYIGDMSAPLKHTSEMSHFRIVEKHIMQVVIDRFNLDDEEPKTVRDADRRMLLTEARDMGLDVTGWYKGYEPLPGKIFPWEPQRAEREFLDRFCELTAERAEYSRAQVKNVHRALAAYGVSCMSQADGHVDQEADVHGN